jgi:uncharacterized hydrophobic protein (TIGR00271 family)
MSQAQQLKNPFSAVLRFRDWLAESLGVTQERKEQIYLDVARSATLLDPSYWLQVLFAAGIATLGLALNSPAVIIGAMLISPLMGPILAAGLALASGDVVLGARAFLNLVLSCSAAVVLAMLLVGALPFKETTGEIMARTQPNTLDLLIALFSGAVGSIAICKEVKGIATSIPGVAIAVALMPPLCVVGYGFGVAATLNAAEGMRVARGGGLLFFTNLVAITFTAMIVFLALHIDTDYVREQIDAWSKEDRESSILRSLMKRLPILEKLRRVGGLPGRFLLVLITMLIMLIPLSQSLSQLVKEIGTKQFENRINQAASKLWDQNYARLSTGEPRSYVGQLRASEQDSKLTIQLTVFTSKPYTPAEKAEFTKQVAERLGRQPDSVALQLIEIPTASSELLARAKEEPKPVAPPTVGQLQAGLAQGLHDALREMVLPQGVRLVDYQATTSLSGPLQLNLVYIADAEISDDAQGLMTTGLRSALGVASAAVTFDRLDTAYGPVDFGRNQSTLTPQAISILDKAGAILRAHPRLKVSITGGQEKNERPGLAGERIETTRSYLVSQWQVSAERITSGPSPEPSRAVYLEITMDRSIFEPANQASGSAN